MKNKVHVENAYAAFMRRNRLDFPNVHPHYFSIFQAEYQYGERRIKREKEKRPLHREDKCCEKLRGVRAVAYAQLEAALTDIKHLLSERGA